MARTRSSPAGATTFGAAHFEDLETGRMILRCTDRKQYLVLVQATVRDCRLSFKARGILAFLLSFPDDWKFNIKHLETCSDKDGRDAIAAGIRELIKHGYARRVTTRGPSGRIESKELQISEAPIFGQLSSVATPQTGNPAQGTEPATLPETALPVEGPDEPQTEKPFRATPRTPLPETAFPAKANPHLPISEVTKQQRNEQTPLTPLGTSASSLPAEHGNFGGGDHNTKRRLTGGAAGSRGITPGPDGAVGKWLRTFRGATEQETTFVLGELAKKRPGEVDNPKGYADRTLKTHRAQRLQAEQTQELVRRTAEQEQDPLCRHQLTLSTCQECRVAADQAQANIAAMIQLLAGKKSA